jgi:hypothetical protein
MVQILSTCEKLNTALNNPTNGSWWMVQILSTCEKLNTAPGNPTNGSWWMVQMLSTCENSTPHPEIHQRQLVDCSDPFYRELDALPKEIPPTAVGGWFRSFYGRKLNAASRNPTNGSWWLVQIFSRITPNSSMPNDKCKCQMSNERTLTSAALT